MTDEAQILDRGYRPYDGARTGVAGAMRTVTVQAIRSVLGLGRPARTKILPIVVAVIAYLPAVVFVGLAVLIGDILDPTEIATYSGYYAFIVLALVLFAAFVAPEALTGDRRNGLLPLYLSTPLTRSTYVASKCAAVVAVTLIVTIGPPLVQLIGYSFEGAGPDGVSGWLGVAWRIVVSGVIISAVFSGVALGISSLTDRRAWASIGIVLVILLSGVVTSVLVEAAELNAHLYLLNLLVAPFELVVRIYGEPSEQPDIGTAAVVASNVAWAAGGGLLTWIRYRTLEVSR